MGRPRVLIVEDEPAISRACTRILEARGFEVTAVSDGRLGAEALARESFEVLLTDVGLPGLGGVELLRLARHRDPDMPVLLMSASASLSEASQAMELGAQRLLVKPFVPDDLVDAVNRAVTARARARETRYASELLAEERGELHRLTESFDSALARLYLVMQPIVIPDEQRVFGYEALLRSGEPSLPHPGAILAAAEQLDRLPDLGRATRAAAAAAVPSLDPEAKLFVNLHPLDLADDELLSPTAPLSAFAHRVVLEMTERAALDDVADCHQRLAALRQLGFSIAIDDLGAGYAGLNSLASLEPEVVKIDMALTRGIESLPVKQKIVGLIVTLCRELGIRVVAEGIETQQEADIVALLGVHLQQGYLYGRPAREPGVIHWRLAPGV